MRKRIHIPLKWLLAIAFGSLFVQAIRGGDDHIRPVRVFDDGAKTYIQMPPDLQHREAPVLLVVGKDGKGEMTNY